MKLGGERGDRTMLVSGGAIGIGRAVAETFAANGYHVVITDVLEQEGREASEAIVATGSSAEFRRLDVRDPAEVQGVVAAVMADRGPLAALVCNAGIARKVALAELDETRWQETLDLNLGGVYRLIRAVTPGMAEAGSGSVVAVSSIMGATYGWQRHAHYSASKAGVIGLVRAAAVELAEHGVRVNGVAPGVIRTAQSLDPINSAGPAGLEEAAGVIPIGRVGEPQEIAEVILFLASTAARYITGQVLTVDGGLTVTSPA